MVAAVSGSRRRIAAALGVPEREIAHEFMRRMADPQPVVEVPSQRAPVHQVIRRGDDIDLTRLPFHVQHEYDGGTYISSGIDFTADPVTGKTNVGCRRLMLRSRDTMRSNLTDASDLKSIYLGCLKRGERLPVSFAIGSHPLDYLAATCKVPIDEFGLVATLRGEPVPMVRGVTNGVLAPADAEMIIEGYFDEHGYRELEAPYGEFYGYYGPVHIDPVFHVTAITTREDVLHQTVLHSGRFLGRADSANLASLHAEVADLERCARCGSSLRRSCAAGLERAPARVALRRPRPDRHAPPSPRCSRSVQVKHAFIVDDDIDVFSRRGDGMGDVGAVPRRPRYRRSFQAARPAPSPNDRRLLHGGQGRLRSHQPVGASTIEAGAPFARGSATPRATRCAPGARERAKYFAEIMDLLGSKDGREAALALDESAQGRYPGAARTTASDAERSVRKLTRSRATSRARQHRPLLPTVPGGHGVVRRRTYRVRGLHYRLVVCRSTGGSLWLLGMWWSHSQRKHQSRTARR